MATLKINGDTSGYVELVSPAVAGSTSIELDKILVSDSSGNVGIGTSSPDSKIHLYDGALHLEQTDGSDTWFSYGTNNDNYITTGTSGITVFRSVGTERMRIDGSGHLLVGQNDTNTPGVGNTTNGHSLRSDGLFFSSAYQGRTGTFGRNGNDGPVLGIYKDGSNAGDLGVKIANSQARLYLGNSNTKILFDNGADRIYPVNNDGDARNGAIDLGLQGAAFKDLYLTGGVDFGGSVNSGGTVSSSNKLDDYEEGTWTPTIGIGTTQTNSFSGGSYTTQNGLYTKIGDKVTLWFHIRLANKGSQSGSVFIKSLPFTGNNISTAAEGSTVSCNYWNSFSNPISLSGYVQLNRPQIVMTNVSGGTSTPGITNSDLSNTSSWYGRVSYKV